MRNTIKNYIDSIDKAIINKKVSKDIIEQHLIKIKFYQHERLIHLLVTLAFAILDMFSVMLLLNIDNVYICFLTILFTLLLIPYIFHYYFLENAVQSMYRQYDELNK